MKQRWIKRQGLTFERQPNCARETFLEVQDTDKEYCRIATIFTAVYIWAEDHSQGKEKRNGGFMLRTDSGTAYRGAYAKPAPSGGFDVERRNSATSGPTHQPEAGLPPSSPGQTTSVFLEKSYSGPFKEHTPTNLHRVSTEYAGPYGSGTKLNELDQTAGVHETGTPQLNPIGTESATRTSSGQYHGALSRGHPPRPS